ncbi:MAG: sulfite exporter TauE/SafE family protein [Candidatus Eisenbacteria bacterium]|nr:sulfite exporter TauE/SafE family protein [Candidatus Eisenbacteria bacterium]
MFTKALLLGLSTGPFCLVYCFPVLFPLSCAGGKSAPGGRLRMLGEFSLGRLAAYLAFGALAGWLGGRFEHRLLASMSGAALVLLSLLLIAYGLVTGFPRLRLCASLGRVLPMRALPLGLGFFTGLNVCPPFLAAAAYVFTLGRVGNGIVFFAVYFLMTTLWLLPLLLAGAAARVERVRWLAQLSALVAGLLFLWMGLGMFARGAA